MELSKLSVLLFFISINTIYCGNSANNNARRMIISKEYAARKDFFTSYRKLQHNVDVLKHRDARNRQEKRILWQRNKIRFLYIGLYIYSALPECIRYMTNDPSKPDAIKITSVNPAIVNSYTSVALGGLVIDINFSKTAGISLMGGYSLMKKHQNDRITGFQCGVSVYFLFKVSSVPFPLNIPLEIIPNALDPFFWIFKLTGLVYKSEFLFGPKFSFWKNSEPKDIVPGFEFNSFTEFKKHWDTRKQKSIINRIFSVLNEYLYFDRRVYLSKHFYYHFNTMILIPIFLSYIQTDCSQTGSWLKENYRSFLLNISLGVLI